MRPLAISAWLALGSVGVLGCGTGSRGAAAPPSPALHLSPLTDLVAAAGLSWMIEIAPRAIASDASLVPAIASVLGEDDLNRMTARYAIDPRQASELVIAEYPQTELLLARANVDPAKVAAALKAVLLDVEGRAADRPGTAKEGASSDPTATIIRTWGTLASSGERAQAATFGVGAAGLEVGHFGPLRAAELFAQGKLRRASPALAVDPLKGTLDRLEEHPASEPNVVRAYAAGPFGDATGAALGGLLRASTAAALAVRVTHPVSAPANTKPTLVCRLVLTGAWGNDAQTAADRLAAAFHVVATSLSGKLLKLDSYAATPVVRGFPDALTLEVAYDAETLASALHLATKGTLDELLSSRSAHAD